MSLPVIGPDMIKEFMDKLERDGKSKDYVDGMLEGMSFVLEFYLGAVTLRGKIDQLIKEEYNVPTEITS